MAASKATTTPTPRASANLSVSFGLVNVPFAMRPLAETAKEVQGKYTCPDHGVLPSGSQRYICSEGSKDEHLLKLGDLITSYPHPDNPDQYVSVDKSVLSEIAEERNGVIDVQTIVDAGAIDPVYFDKTYLCWPQKGGEQAFDLFAEVLRTENKAAVSTVVLFKQTVSVVIRWSPEVDALVAHTCRYHAQLRWNDVGLVQAGAAGRGVPSQQHLDAARTLLASMEGEFDTSGVVDTYTPMLKDAIRAAAGDKTISAPVRPEAPAPAADLLGALMASVQAAGEPAPKKKTTAAPGKRSSTRKKVTT